MKYLVSSLLFLATAGVQFAHAADPYKDIDDARVARDQQKYPFLYPGFRFLIQPAAEGGPSIAGLYDGDGGFILCMSAQNPSNEAVTAPFHCNSRITALGFHVPADIIFGHPGVLANLKDFARIGGEFFLNAAGTVTQMNSVTSEAAQTTQNATGQTPIQEVVGRHQLKATMDRLYASAQKGWQYCDANPVTSPAPYYMADLAKDLQDRVRTYEKTCFNHKVALNKKIDITDPEIYDEIMNDKNWLDKVNKDKDGEIFCHEQQHNQAMAASVTELCNIQSVTAQAGETGNPELWFPGQAVPSACKQALMNFVAKDKDGNVMKTADGKTIPIGAPMLAWLSQQYKKINGVVPTSSGENDAIAQHVGACLAHNPEAEHIEEKLQQDLNEGKDLPTQDPAPATSTTPAAPVTGTAPASS